jgi:hypothetical protein
MAILFGNEHNKNLGGCMDCSANTVAIDPNWLVETITHSTCDDPLSDSQNKDWRIAALRLPVQNIDQRHTTHWDR